MKISNILQLYLILLFFFLISCSPYRNNPIKRALSDGLLVGGAVGAGIGALASSNYPQSILVGSGIGAVTGAGGSVIYIYQQKAKEVALLDKEIKNNIVIIQSNNLLIGKLRRKILQDIQNNSNLPNIEMNRHDNQRAPFQGPSIGNYLRY